ncbi:hypothetical protein CK230_25300 [Mesorhizobium sp. WSM3859]|nr:hypothetical protein CK230_25300 [Mesorhizobium sp. WSM3859]
MAPKHEASEAAIARANRLRAESDRIRTALKLESDRARQLTTEISNLLRHAKGTGGGRQR